MHLWSIGATLVPYTFSDNPYPLPGWVVAFQWQDCSTPATSSMLGRYQGAALYITSSLAIPSSFWSSKGYIISPICIYDPLGFTIIPYLHLPIQGGRMGTATIYSNAALTETYVWQWGKFPHFSLLGTGHPCIAGLDAHDHLCAILVSRNKVGDKTFTWRRACFSAEGLETCTCESTMEIHGKRRAGIWISILGTLTQWNWSNNFVQNMIWVE